MRDNGRGLAAGQARVGGCKQAVFFRCLPCTLQNCRVVVALAVAVLSLLTAPATAVPSADFNLSACVDQVNRAYACVTANTDASGSYPASACCPIAQYTIDACAQGSSLLFDRWSVFTNNFSQSSDGLTAATQNGLGACVPYTIASTFVGAWGSRRSGATGFCRTQICGAALGSLAGVR